MYAFARSQGLFVGVSLEGSVISPREHGTSEFMAKTRRQRGFFWKPQRRPALKALGGWTPAMP